MDTDGLPSAAIFVAFLFLFSCLSFARHYPASTVNRSSINRSSEKAAPRWIVPALGWLRYACVIAVALSGLALIHSTGTVAWWPASLLALALLLFLVAIDRLAGIVGGRRPSWIAPWQRILPRSQPSNPGPDGNSGFVDNGSNNSFGEAPGERPQPAITQAELVSMDHRDIEMLRSILRLDVTTAREIMVPRLDMVVVEADSSLAQVAEKMAQSGRSRLPVYEETIDRVLGIIHARDVLASLAGGTGRQGLRDMVRPAFIIPETKRLDDLLEELQDKGVQMAVVVDEYGGTEGLVTMEDVLEEIVGEIEDEFSRTREALVVQLPDGAVLVDAGVTTENIEEMFNTRIDSSEVDTVGGYVYHSLGKIPQVGDTVVTDHLSIEVVSILGRRLRRLRIKQLDGAGPDAAS